MSFRRENDVWGNASSQTLSIFNGSKYGTGLCDQPKECAYICDFDCRNKKLELREGMRKNDPRGFNHSVEGLFNINIWDRGYMGIVQNGILAVSEVDDVLAGKARTYYTWGDVLQKFTWQQLSNLLVDELLDGVST